MSSRGKGNPHSKNSPNRIALFQQLKAIAEPIDLESEPLWKTEVWRFRLYFHRHVIGEFLNELDIKDVKDFYLIDRFIKKDYKKWVKLETNLWYETWLSIEKIVHIDEQIYKEPWLIFIRVILEMKLFDMGLNYRIDPEEIPSAKTMTRQYQLENESIRYYENPFNQEDAPVTFELLERLRKLWISSSFPFLEGKTKDSGLYSCGLILSRIFCNSGLIGKYLTLPVLVAFLIRTSLT